MILFENVRIIILQIYTYVEWNIARFSQGVLLVFHCASDIFVQFSSSFQLIGSAGMQFIYVAGFICARATDFFVITGDLWSENKN